MLSKRVLHLLLLLKLIHSIAGTLVRPQLLPTKRVLHLLHAIRLLLLHAKRTSPLGAARRCVAHAATKIVQVRLRVGGDAPTRLRRCVAHGLLPRAA